jgi:urocanate hydratase
VEIDDSFFHHTAKHAILWNMTQAVPDTPRATDRGLSLLRVVAEHPEGLALADLARAVGLSASTALRQLRSLEAARFAAHAADGRWVPGPELLRLARTLTAGATLPRLAEPLLVELAATLGESAYLAEPSDPRHATYVGMAPGTHAVRHVSWLGQTVRRRGSAVGQALAGNISPDGVAVRHDAVEPGVTAVSAPVFGAGGRIIAAISVVGPSYRLSGDALATARRHVALQARRLGELA